MKKYNNQKSFYKRPAILLCLFASMLIFASFSKEDRQKVRSFKLKMMEKYIHHSLADNTDEVLVAKPHLKNHYTKGKAEISQQKGMISNEDYNYEPAFLKENNGIAASNAISYQAKEKEGTIGTFSNKEEDRLSDNFFTVDIPEKKGAIW
uniref:GLPGLI family protein n=1 Tax=Chryseobacterium endophyticum TaxID=1854762 RepID=A0AAU6WPQ1_9FLAO